MQKAVVAYACVNSEYFHWCHRFTRLNGSLKSTSVKFQLCLMFALSTRLEKLDHFRLVSCIDQNITPRTTMADKNQQPSGGQWKSGLFSCFSNCCLCAITYFAPCYVAGKVAETTGESFWLHCCMTFVPIGNIICRSKIRQSIRHERQIDGSNCNDYVVHWFCALCALVQEATEVNAIDRGSMAEHPVQEISRS